jgi:hypothetical protein
LVIFRASDRRDDLQAEATVRRPKLRREIAEPYHLHKLVGLATLTASPPCTPRKHRHVLSRLEAVVQHRVQSTLQNTVAPAGPLRRSKKSASTPTSHSTSPHHGASRQPLHRSQERLQCRRHPFQYRYLAGVDHRNPSHHGETSPLSLVRPIWIRRIKTVHLKSKGYQIWAAQIRLNPTARVADPTETVPANQITPRVGFLSKQKFDLEFETRFDPNLQKIISFDL